MKRRLFILYFFLSGMCGLIYQVVWVRMFGLTVGVTIYAFTTVVVAFMAGLALGGYLGGRYADRTMRNPLRVYGILEGAIGIYALIIPLLITALGPLFAFFYQNLEQNSLLFLLLRFFICGLVLMVPTTMMGATLPVLVRHDYTGREHFGWTTGRLYAVNTLGAVFGSFVGGFVLIPRLGQSATIYTAAAINILIFAIIFIFHRGEASAVNETPVLEAIRERLKPLTPAALVLLVGYGLSGAAAMCYQVAWTNALILSIGISMYAIGLILTAFIAGLGIGGAVMSPLADRIKKPFLWAGLMEILIALSAVAVVPAIGRLPLWIQNIQVLSDYNRDMAVRFLVAFGLVFVPTFLMGALLPLVCRIYGEKRGGAGRAIGHIYSSNTMGSVIGAFITGIFLISWLGLRTTILSASVMSFIIGAAFLLFSEVRRWRQGAVLAGSGIIITLSILFVPPWQPEVMSAAPYLHVKQFETTSQNTKELFLLGHLESLYYKEGATATISVNRDKVRNFNTLLINGNPMASDREDLAPQFLMGHLPILLGKNPERVMVLGLGIGTTLGATTQHPVKEIDCLEISPEVVEASRFFNDINNNPLSDPRVNLIINDGRNHLAYTNKTYDVITSDPINPWVSGSGILYTKELFELAKKRLNPSGVFLCYFMVSYLDQEIARLFIRTFGSVFPEMSLWECLPGRDYVLVGSKEKFEIDLDLYMNHFKHPPVPENLARIGDDPLRVLARFMMGPRALAKMAGDGPLHTDDKRQIEYMVPKRFKVTPYNRRIHPLSRQLKKHSEDIAPYLRSPSLEEKNEAKLKLEPCSKARRYIMNAVLASTETPPRYDDELYFLEMAWNTCPGDLSVKENLLNRYYDRANILLKDKKTQEARSDLEKIVSLDEQDYLVYDALGKFAHDVGDMESARKWYKNSLVVDPQNARALFLLGSLELGSGRVGRARGLLESAVRFYPGFSEKDNIRPYYRPLSGFVGWRVDAMALEHLGKISLREGKLGEAERQFRRALSISESFENARLGLAVTLARQQRFDEAEAEYKTILEKNPDSTLVYFYLGQLLFSLPGREREAGAHLRKVLELDPNFPARETIRNMLR